MENQTVSVLGASAFNRSLLAHDWTATSMVGRPGYLRQLGKYLGE